VQTRRIRIDDIEISCAEAGEAGQTGDGAPLVMVHGFTGHRDDFRDVLPELARDGWVLAPDLRGHGDCTHTGRAETFTFAQLVDDLNVLLDALEIERCDLLGHSFGGMVALRFVLAHPERVASLVLMDTAPFAPDGYDRGVFEKAGAIAEARGMSFLQELVEKAGRADSAPNPSDKQTRKWGDYYWEHMRKRYGAMDPAAYAAFGLEMMDQSSLADRLGEIACPATILVGSDDEAFQRGADAFEAGIPAAKRVTIEDAGHHPHIENTAPWLAALRAHRARAAAPSGP
jgi:pimeloyl-ACP methyl ester carboxylesterase